MAEPGPQSLSDVLAKLIALRGYARRQGDAQLQQAWTEVAGTQFASRTRALSIKRAVLHVAVAQSALHAELVSFHRQKLLAKFQAQFPHLKIKDLKFKLDSGVNPSQPTDE